MLVKIDHSCCSKNRKPTTKPCSEEHLGLKAFPKQANELPAAKEWPAFGRFLEAINRCSIFRTCGCHVSLTDVPFVDITFTDPQLSTSFIACQHLMSQIHQLDGTDISGSFPIELSETSITLQGQHLEVMRLWLVGPRCNAADVFKAIISVLERQNSDEYLSIVAEEKLQVKKENDYCLPIAVVFFLVWFGVACGGAHLAATQYGWVAGIGGFVGGLGIFLILVILAFYLCISTLKLYSKLRD